MNKKIHIYDSTLRDGCQGEGIVFTVEDKINIVRVLDDFGVDYIEAGTPGSNPKDLEFFSKAKNIPLKNAKIVAFGSTRHCDTIIDEDKNIQALMNAETDDICVFGKSWDLHVTEILKTSLEKNLHIIAETIEYLSSKGKNVHFDAEHFFDGYIQDPEYAMSVIKTAEQAGAKTITLCDTNGGFFPDQIQKITRNVLDVIKTDVGIHCHNDTECAAANTIIAVKEGINLVQGTFTGFGERCGNANLSALIPNLQLKAGYDCIPACKMKDLTTIARYIAECANINLSNNMAYVGKNAFTHKGGIHVDGVNKNTVSYEHIKPELVGNQRNVLISELAGRTAMLHKLNKVVPDLTKNSPETVELINTLKNLEHKGYQYEAAYASLKLVVLKKLGRFTPKFELDDFHVLGLKQGTDNKSIATVKVKVRGETYITADEGEGPVHALDKAFRRAVTNFFPEIEKVRLVDYKVRILDTTQGTATKVRVLIETTDGENVWTTVGVSTDIINASINALIDSIEYKLLN